MLLTASLGALQFKSPTSDAHLVLRRSTRGCSSASNLASKTGPQSRAADGAHESRTEQHGADKRAFYLELVELTETVLHGREQLTWFQRLDRELANFRAALKWCAKGQNDQHAVNGQ